MIPIFNTLAKDGDGRLKMDWKASTTLAASLEGAGQSGLAMSSARIGYYADAGAVVPSTRQMIGGLALTEDGAIYITTDAPSSASQRVGGIALRADGALHLAGADAAIAHRVGGLAITASGQVIGDTSVLAELADAGAGVVDTSLLLGTASATFTRASTAWTVLSDGTIGAVASGSPRSYYSPTGTYLGFLSEQESTNLVLESQAFGAAWTAVGTPPVTNGTTTLGELSLATLGDDDATTTEGVLQAITFTGDTQKGVAVYVKKGTSASSVIILRDTTASATRLLATITWSGTVPVVTMTTGTDLTGTPQQHGSSGVYRLLFRATAVVAANTNQLQLYPATDAALDVSLTGNIEWGGFQAEDDVGPSSYILTTSATVTRAADKLVYNTFVPWPASLYCEATPLVLPNTLELVHYVVMSSSDGADGYGIGRSDYDLSFSGHAVSKLATVETALVEVGVQAVNVTSKVAGSFELNRVNAALDGAAGTADTVAAAPSLAEITIGCSHLGAQQPAACIKNVRIWQRRIEDDVIQDITT